MNEFGPSRQGGLTERQEIMRERHETAQLCKELDL